MLGNPGSECLAGHLIDARYLVSERAALIDRKLMEAAPKLDFILRIGSFTHDIDLETAREAGIVVCRWPVAGAGLVAEHIVMQMLALARRLIHAQATTLAGYDRVSRRTDENTFAFNWSGMDGLTSLSGLTIGAMKAGSYLVSCGSGATIDEAAAAEAVKSGHLAGIALDTYEWEPLPVMSPLVSLADSGFNVVLTPHIAGGDRESAAEERRAYYTNITNHLGRKPVRFRLVLGPAARRRPDKNVDWPGMLKPLAFSFICV